MVTPRKRRRIGVDLRVMSQFSYTGIVTFVQGVLPRLIEASPDCEWILFSQSDRLGFDYSQFSNARLERSPWMKSGWLWKAFGSAFLSHRLSIDVLYIPAHRVPLIRLVPTVVVIHDLGFEIFPATFRIADRYRISWATRMAARNADHLIAVSESTKRDLINMYKCRPERIHVTHLGYDRQVFDPSPVSVEARTRTLEKYGLRQPFFLHVGVLQPRKNIVRLIDAFAQLIHEKGRSDLQLAIVGKLGWKFGEIIKRAEAPDVRKQVIITGTVESLELPILYKSALALLMPSLYEGFGLPIVESMACGTPVACSRNSSMSEVAGEAALLFDPYSVQEIAATMRRLSQEPALRAQMIERGFHQAKHFSWENTARQTLEVLFAATGADGKVVSLFDHAQHEQG
jgi:glycosyltransferase involved in cell wall biosynthesis